MSESKTCRQCGKEITTYPCAFCGAKERSTSDIGFKIGCFGILGVIAFSLILNPFISDSDSGAEHSAVGAWVMCENFVEDRLRAPATADFPCCYSDFVTHEGGGVYRAEAYVDAENAFGAQIRSDFTCTVEHRSGDRWRLQDLEITER